MTNDFEYRRLIKFGNNSHVISVPKKWVDKHNLKKGDNVYLFENGKNELIIAPEKTSEDITNREITINVDGKTNAVLRREIVAAYLNHYHTIKLEGSSIMDNAESIKSIINDLIALEIVEQTSSSIVTRDFMNMKELTLTELMHRMEIIVRSMIMDMQHIFERDYSKSFSERDKDIDRMFFAFKRGVFYALKYPNVLQEYKMDLTSLFRYYNVCYNLEAIGDKLKDVALLVRKKQLAPELQKKIKKLILAYEETYPEIIKVHATKNTEQSILLSVKKEELRRMCEQACNDVRSEPTVVSMCEKMRSVATHLHQILHDVHDHAIHGEALWHQT